MWTALTGNFYNFALIWHSLSLLLWPMVSPTYIGITTDFWDLESLLQQATYNTSVFLKFFHPFSVVSHFPSFYSSIPHHCFHFCPRGIKSTSLFSPAWSKDLCSEWYLQYQKVFLLSKFKLLFWLQQHKVIVLLLCSFVGIRMAALHSSEFHGVSLYKE